MKEVSDVRGIYIREMVLRTCMEIWAWDDTHTWRLTCVEVKKLRWRKRMNTYRGGCGDDGSRLSRIGCVLAQKHELY